MSKKHGAAFSVEGVGGAGADCVEGMGSSHVRESWACTGGAEAAVVSGATGGIVPPAVGLLGVVRAARVVVIERCSDLAEPLCAQLAPVGELVVSVPAPRCDHREHEDPTIAKQVLIGCRIVLTDFLGRMRDVELDRSAAAGLEVYKEQPSLRPEQVAWMRLAVQQLLASATPFDSAPQVSQRLAEKLPLCVRKLWSVGAVGNQRLRLFDSIREVRRSHIDLPHAGMQPLQNLRILRWCDVTRRHRLVVFPQRDCEAVTHVDARLHARLRLSHRTIGLGELPSDLNLELIAGLTRYIGDASKNVTRQEAHSDAIGVVNHNCVIDQEAKR